MSYLCVGGFILAVIATVILINLYLSTILRSNPTTEQYAGTIVSLINASQIIVFDTFYDYLSEILTSYENPRTSSDYENSTILKKFVVKFINAYSSFFYTAFVLKNLPHRPGIYIDIY